MDDPFADLVHLLHFSSDLYDKLGDEYILESGGKPIYELTHIELLAWLIEKEYIHLDEEGEHEE